MNKNNIIICDICQSAIAMNVWSSGWDDNKEIAIRVPIMRDKVLSYAEYKEFDELTKL